MPSDSGHTTPFWFAAADVPGYPPLAADVTTDVCVVGAGIAGLTTAYLLARAGRRVVVIDDGPIAGGETGRTTAHLANAMDDFYSEIERLHGPGGARSAAASHSAAIAKVGEIAAAEGIDCEYRRLDGYLFLADGDSRADLEEELAAARRAGLAGVELLERAPGAPFDTGPCLRFPDQGQFHPVKYLAGLARAVERHGGRIHNGTHATAIADGTPATVTTGEGRTISADAVVVATNSPVNDWVRMHTKQAPYRTYVIGLPVPAGSVATALYWDSGDPYHYVRLARGAADGAGGGTDVLIVGGEDHKTGQADDAEARFRRLEEWTRARFPAAGPVEHRWSGQVLEPVDYMGFIGRNPGDEHVFIVTGDSGQGTTHGTIAGMLLTDLIAGRPNEWAALYEPARKTLRAAGEFARENLNVARQYLDHVAPGEVRSAEQVKPGEGAVLRRGARHVAVYRDADGRLHERSASCTHLFCIVHWNHGERSWDCPCHGSRFDPYGRVINGPAIADLPEAE
jgi:glycine/D-amino acid oxidase-like deaminating enzyme/nitrite reductase/ring-hydroxylating ferredoxin subunit